MEAPSESDADEVLRAVSAAVLAVTRHLSVAEVLTVIVGSARQLLGAEYAALGIPDEAGGFAEFITDGISERQREVIGPLPRQHGMLAALLHDGETIRVRDIRADARFGYFPSGHPAMTDFLGMPIRDGDEIIGILFLADKAGGFAERDEQLLDLFASHAAIAIANARLHERGRELTLIEERNRLARELHDAVSQKLFSLRLSARTATRLMDADAQAARAELTRVETLAAEAVAELRAVIVELRPADLSAHGLVETVRKHLDLVRRAYAIDASLDADADGEFDLDDDAEVDVLRMIQEAVHNAVRHSEADRIDVRLRAGARVVAEVSDDGIGFDPDHAALHGLGLASMRERAETLGGCLEVLTRPGRGTTVRLEMPCG
ncbi:MAG: GAF domain-containing protein [Stackebrandtia sp.]